MDFYRINSLLYPLILERAIRSSMSRYHPCPRPILASLVVIRTKSIGGREEGGSIEGRVSVCLLVRRGFSRGALAWKNQPGER